MFVVDSDDAADDEAFFQREAELRRKMDLLGGKPIVQKLVENHDVVSDFEDVVKPKKKIQKRTKKIKKVESRPPAIESEDDQADLQEDGPKVMSEGNVTDEDEQRVRNTEEMAPKASRKMKKIRIIEVY